MLDSLADGVSFALVVEIFEPGGKTPQNTHTIAEEAFFVMAGSGKAYADGQGQDIGPGDVRPSPDMGGDRISPRFQKTRSRIPVGKRRTVISSPIPVSASGVMCGVGRAPNGVGGYRPLANCSFPSIR
jgi:hypothetical protein